jgi:hypothetical protein
MTVLLLLTHAVAVDAGPGEREQIAPRIRPATIGIPHHFSGIPQDSRH